MGVAVLGTVRGPPRKVTDRLYPPPAWIAWVQDGGCQQTVSAEELVAGTLAKSLEARTPGR